MSFTLMEGAIALLLVWIAWRIGRILGPYLLRRFKDRSPPKFPPNRKEKPPIVIDS